MEQLPALKFKTKHFLTGQELSVSELDGLLKLAIRLKKIKQSNEKHPQTLADKTLALIFEKPSMRTRVSFTVGIGQLGGKVIVLSSAERKKESPADTVRVLQGYVDGLMVRTFEHGILQSMAEHSKIPLINGLSDLHHPCQALADMQTLLERFGHLRGLKLAYVGDGNNMLHSLMLMLPRMGVDVHYACPEGFEPDPEIVAEARKVAAGSDAKVLNFKTAAEAVRGVNAIYTDVWASMGFEDQAKSRLKKFESFQVNSTLYSLAAEGAVIMHCMPVNENQEISREMIEHKNSVMFQQSENRLHAQKALIMGLFAH